MVVKEKVGRKRYILVNISSNGLPRSSIIHQINREFNRFSRKRTDLPRDINPPWLTVLENRYAIFRCAHIHKDPIVEFLDNLVIAPFSRPGSEETRITCRVLKVSGTIKKLKVKIENMKKSRGVHHGSERPQSF